MTDDARQIAFDERAPPDERFDANAELQQTYMPSTVSPLGDMREMIEYIQDDMAEQQMLQKSQRAKIIQFPGDEHRKTAAAQSVFLDKHQIFARGEFFEKPAPVGFEALRQMVEQTPVLAAVVMTRVRQVNRFCGVSEDGGIGYTLRHRNLDHELEPDEQTSINLMAQFFEHCGWEFRPRHRRRLRRDSFSQFMSKLVRDSLTFDAAPIETEQRKGVGEGINGLYAVDGATIRLCDDEGYQGNDEFFAVQIIQQQVRTAYTYDNLIYEPRNPRTDVRANGYGIGEAELLVRVVTGWLNALTLNIKGFSDNAIPRGILHLSGDYGQKDLAAFRRYWNSMVKGVNNAWAMPILVSKDQESKAEFSAIDTGFSEMYFSKWMTFLTSIICAIYSIAPDEINFEAFSAGHSALSGKDTEEKITASKDKGLRPLLSYFESIFTDYVVADFDQKYVFRWTGLDEKDQEKEWEAKKLTMTLNELRAEQGLQPIEDKMLGDAPVNPNLMGVYMQSAQQQNQDFGNVPAAGPPGNGPQGGQGAQEIGQPGAGPPGPPPRQGAPGTPAQGQPQPFGKSAPCIWTI